MFLQLIDLSTRHRVEKRALMLGRQKFDGNPGLERWYKPALEEAGRELDWHELIAEDGYSETALAALGFGNVESLDYSAFEGADHTHDLNLPVGPDLRGQFDLIIDGGTLEHVFNLPQALANVFEMLRPGGVFAACNPFNGWPAHGIYQFGPELVWTFWKRAAGCEVLRCKMLPKHPSRPSMDLADAQEMGHRVRMKGKVPEGRSYMYYEVRKSEGAKLTGRVLSGDYQVIWSAEDSKSAKAASA
ncbi:MAG: class I SAM-dependent methyltransferase [Pikeienuella sp.]